MLSKENLSVWLGVNKYEFGPQIQHVNRGGKIFVQVQFAGLTPWERSFLFSHTETIDQKERKLDPVNGYILRIA